MRTSSRRILVWGVGAFLTLFLLSLFLVEGEAEAKRRRGKGARRGAAGQVSGKRRAAARRNRNNDNVVIVDANGDDVAVNPNSLSLLGLRVFNNLDSFGVDRFGRVFELNPNAVVDGRIANPESAIRQPVLRGGGGQLFAGERASMLPRALEQAQAFNQGDVDAVPSGSGRPVAGSP